MELSSHYLPLRVLLWWNNFQFQTIHTVRTILGTCSKNITLSSIPIESILVVYYYLPYRKVWYIVTVPSRTNGNTFVGYVM